MLQRHLRIISLSVILAMLVVFLPTLTHGVAAAPLVTVGANVNVSAAAGNQSEASIAVDPNNPMRIFVASNPGTTAAFSTDGGATWTRYTMAGTCCDNVAAFDDFGNLFMVNINGALNQIDLYLSTTGGTSGSFTLLQTLDSGANVDQPSIAVGHGVGNRSIWATWNKGGNIRARGAPVTGLGAVGAFIAAQDAPNSNTVGGQFGDIAVGPAGQVTVAYQSNNRIYINTDADGLGAGGFAAQVNVTGTNVAKFDFIPAQSTRSIDAEVGLVYDMSGGPNNGRLYMVYTDEPVDENNDTEIMLRTSTNNGATWTAAVRVNDDATLRSQFLPSISIDQSTGNIAIAWHDARNDSGSGAGTTNAIANDDSQFWGTFSVDGGATFLPNVKISAGTSNAAAAANGIDYGDYRGSNFAQGLFYPAWSDNSNSTGDNPNGALSRFDIYTAQVRLATIDTTTVASGSATYGGTTATLTATVTQTVGGAPVPAGGTVTFTYNGNNYPATTNALGVATTTAPLPPGTNAGTYPNAVHAAYAGAGIYLPSAADGPLVVKRRILWLHSIDRTVGFQQPNPSTTPPAGCALAGTPTSACWLELANGTTFAPGDSWTSLNLTSLRFAYSRNYPDSNVSEYVGKTYKIAAIGVSSTNYEVKYQLGILKVVP